ncbi:MAG: flagellar motor protein MotB [Pyrinomonadaceae bacterium]
MDEESSLDFTFWPSFADLMLALVLILVLVIFLITVVIAAGTVNLSTVEKNQSAVINEIASVYGSAGVEVTKEANGASTYFISITGPESKDLVIRNELSLQRITFTDNILFLPDDYQLNPRGERVLEKVGAALKDQLAKKNIREIQIQGHADTDKTSRHGSNLELASLRAMRVFEFLQKDIGINPAEHLMSATTFGEYKPVQRSNDEFNYDEAKLREHNGTPELKGHNRRIELMLFYRVNEVTAHK